MAQVRPRPRTYQEARSWSDEFEASLSPQEKLRRSKEAEAFASDMADRVLGPLRKAQQALGLDQDEPWV